MRIFTLLLLLISGFSPHAQLQKYSFNQPKMGSPFKIVVYANDSTPLAQAVKKAYAYVDTLNAIFSDYDGTSEISVLAKSYIPKEWINISPTLWTVLKLARQAAKDSKGAFDISVGNIVKHWRKVRKEKRKPHADSLKFALNKTGFHHLEIDEKQPKIRFHTEGVLLDFGGIVKGYAAQEVVRILTESGFPSCFADAGGDIAFGSKPPDKDYWSIGVTLPNSENQLFESFILLKNKAIATSGDMYNFTEIEGVRYSHIVNPKTGLGLTHQRNVTVIAQDGATADWLATACSVLSPKKALKLVKLYPEAALLIVENRKEGIKMWQSEGLFKYFVAF
jgi:FAD:protein FMN transferase